jgi:hypothetical protein
LTNLVETGTDGFRTAANTALAGTDADVQAFLRSQDYPGRAAGDRIAVDQILYAAQQSGGIATEDAAQQALDANTDQALRQFLTKNQYIAAGHDERIKADQILASDDSGPELKAAAQIALDGTAGMLHQFVTVGQFAAAQRDQDSAAHNAQIAGYLAQAAETANTASQHANEAQAAAATARGAAADAAGYAQQARNDAGQAATYAQQAHQSALDAENSATRAAQSASIAQNAATSANQSAQNASRSAMWATSSEHQAAGFAVKAYGYAHDAFTSAQNAGSDASVAADAANAVLTDVLHKVADEKLAAKAQQYTDCDQYKQFGDKYQDCLHLVFQSDYDNRILMLQNGAMCGKIDRVGSDQYKQCVSDVLSPSFKEDQNLNIMADAFASIAKIETLWGGAVLGMLCAAAEPCGVLLASVVPEGTAFTSWMTAAGVDALVSTRIAAMFEESSVQGISGEATYSDLLAALARTVCSPNSFSGNTQVLLPGGATKPIKDVAIGDQVANAQPDSLHLEAHAVTEVHVTDDDTDFDDLTVATASGPETITATAHHPFWDATVHAWTNAADLRLGDKLDTPGDGHVTVVANRRYVDHIRTYNLTVDTVHTYYVLAGTTPVLVHNSGCVDIEMGPGAGSADALKAFVSLKPETEFVFDPGTGRFLLGDREPIPGGLSPHEQLVAKLGADPKTVAGGTMYRNADGGLVFTQESGHFGQNWTPQVWSQFQNLMKSSGVRADFQSWG